MASSLWSLVAASLASVLLGALWYHPRVFGALWMRLSQVTPEMAERGARWRHLYIAAGFAAGLLIAYAMEEIGRRVGAVDVAGAARLGFLLWLGFVVPTSLGIVLWDHRPVSLYLINVSFWLVALVAMAVVLVV